MFNPLKVNKMVGYLLLKNGDAADRKEWLRHIKRQRTKAGSFVWPSQENDGAFHS